MSPRQRRLNPVNPVERFAIALRDLHRLAGKPKQQQLAAAMHCSHATVSAILNGHRFPSWRQAEALVKACGGDIQEWRSLWIQADQAMNAAHLGDETETDRNHQDDSVERHPRFLSDEIFYSAMVEQARLARRRIMITYLRHRPPDYYMGFTDDRTSEAATQYFEGILEWARQSENRLVRRNYMCT